jgi:hypothetical protein
MPRVAGHLFIINGDLTKIAVDAILIPTDLRFEIEPPWRTLVWPKMWQVKDPAKWAPADWGRASVVMLPWAPREPRIWLGDIGQPGNYFDFTVFKPMVCEFVETAGADAKKIPADQRICAWPKRRLAVHVVGSGEGGGRHRKGELVAGLVETLQQLAAENEVDIVLVASDEKKYAAAQRARRRVVNDTRLEDIWQFDEKTDPSLPARAQKLAQHAIDRQLVLFIGSGVSAGAGLPTWEQLIGRMAKKANIPDDVADRILKKDLRDQATILERRWDPATNTNLKASVAEELNNSTLYALAHGLLASLPSKEAITTNFDTLFEEASSGGTRQLAVLPDSPLDTDGRWLLKLHGSVGEPKNIVLTRSDFLEMPRRYGALMGLVQGLLMMRHLMFVGYSLKDEDFHELVHEVRTARGKNAAAIIRGTVLTLKDDDLERELWADDLDIIPMVTKKQPGHVNAQTNNDTTNDDILKAARQLELFLDLVAYLSTTSAAFFLDEDYNSLSDDEPELRDALRKLVDMTENAGADSVAHKVRRFLEQEMGADSA